MDNVNFENLQNTQFRNRLRKNPKQILKQEGNNLGVDFSRYDKVDFVIKTNTKNKYYIAMPYQQGTVVDIASIQAAGSASTAGTVGTASSLASCVLSVSTVGSAGSAS